jgi:hypothetical protein
MGIRIAFATVLLSFTLAGCSSKFVPTEADFAKQSVSVVENQFGECLSKYANDVKYEYNPDTYIYDDLKSPGVTAYLNENPSSFQLWGALVIFDVIWDSETQSYFSLISPQGGVFDDNEAFNRFFVGGCNPEEALGVDLVPLSGQCDNLTSVMAGYFALINGDETYPTKQESEDSLTRTATQLDSIISDHKFITSDKLMIQAVLDGIYEIQGGETINGISSVSNGWREIENRCGNE